MLRRALLATLPLALAASAAQASEGPKVEVGQYVDLSPVAMPIVVRGQLVNYVFVYVRINLTNSANMLKLRDKEPFFRDALVRAGHRTPFVKADDYQVVDAARLCATLKQQAISIAGPGAIQSVVVTSQAPMKRIPPPKPRSAVGRS
jgi:flagellar basal body-associated protein FliL